MGRLVLSKPMVLFATLFFLLLFLLSAQAQQAAPQKEKTVAAKTKAGAGANSAPADAADYVGMETCKTCHEDTYAGLRSIP